MKKAILKSFAIFAGKHRCFPINIAKFKEHLFLKKVCETAAFVYTEAEAANSRCATSLNLVLKVAFDIG